MAEENKKTTTQKTKNTKKDVKEKELKQKKDTQKEKKQENLNHTMIFDGNQKKNLKEVVEKLEKENIVLKDKVIKRSKIKKTIVIILVIIMLLVMITTGIIIGKELYNIPKQEPKIETLNSNLYDKVNKYRTEINNKKENKKDKQEDKKTVLKQITLTEFENKVLDKENMTILVSSSTCLYCMQFEPIVEEVLKEQEKIIYVIEIKSMDDIEVERFREYYEFTITPTIFTIKDGIVTAEQTGATTKEKLEKWMIENAE